MITFHEKAQRITGSPRPSAMHWHEGPNHPMKFRGGSPLQVRNDSRRGSPRAGCMNSHKDNVWAPTASIKTR